MARGWKNIFEMQKAIPTEREAVKYFSKIHWASGEYCPHCRHREIYKFSDGVTFKCAACRKRFSIRVGTIFEDSKVEMRKWLYAIWMLTSHKKGIASTTLARDIGVTQKTAWFMLQRLRYAARTRSFNRPLKGTVEVDEGYFGGKERFKHRRDRKGLIGGQGKVLAVGLLERGGELRVNTIERTTDLRAAVTRNVKEGSRLMTDEATAFSGLEALYERKSFSHKRGIYGDGKDGHTNSIEGVWSLIKRQIYGIHHFVSPKHIAKYFDEAVFRYNRRNVTDRDRVAEFLGRVHGRLTYKELIA